MRRQSLSGHGCELLSKFVYICSWNNQASHSYSATLVVNCFRNLFIFAAETTPAQVQGWPQRLWIAFEICLYLQLKQQVSLSAQVCICCELLSKFVYICSWNNWCVGRPWAAMVVNCFRNLFIFAAETTRLWPSRRVQELWIAFEICLYLQLKQLFSIGVKYTIGCELLSKFVYICSWNNLIFSNATLFMVVNCFRNLFIFAAETTLTMVETQRNLLWIAFEICLYLQLKQRNLVKSLS